MNEVEVLVTAETLPGYARAGDAGADLHAAEPASLKPWSRVLVATGVKIALPNGYVGLVHPRSGLAAKHSVTVLNAPGTIDAGYRGEIKVLLVNLSDEQYEVQAGDRIAQLVVQRVERAAFVQVDRLPGSDRGEGGFGSTGFSGEVNVTSDSQEIS